ncbi:MAG TPA: cytochrome c oxidase subunit II [Acidimicrobiia bacterium]|nr:cytochrome c oxidase subunit II [Acidimicrobiia bacterium]
MAAAALVVLAGCGTAKNNGQNALQPKGPAAQKINNLFVPIAIIAIVIGILVLGATVWFAIRFRYRAGKNDNPKQVHGNTRLEIGWTIAPALLLAVIAVPSVSAIFELAQNPGPQALQVTVVGKQWWWQFEYPDAKVVTADELVIPAGRDVHLSLKACEDQVCNVIHSFWVPELAGTRDVVPGQTNELTIKADNPGTYLGQCKEYCGLSHANMRFRVIAKTPAEFQDWIRGQQQGPANPLLQDGKPAGDAQRLIVNTFECTNCHSLEDSSVPSYGPNLTHLASRDYFASANLPLNRTNLVDWIMNAPGILPMQTEQTKCRPAPQTGCVGMPSFTENVPAGQPKMTRAQAEQIADFLLEQK